MPGTYFLEKTIEVDMDDVPSVRIHKDVFEMTITKAKIEVNEVGRRKGATTYPSMNPIIDITAAVLP